MATNVRISSALGSGEPFRAKLVMVISIALGLVTALFNIGVLLLVSRWIGHIFSSDPQVISMIESIAWSIALAHFANAIATILGAGLVAQARPKVLTGYTV
jgi:Na+-driven multidrug efflux pump